jgi:hypothetical protein
MASHPGIRPFAVDVRFESRDDGGLRATCDQVPNFFLSHRDPEMVIADVVPALSVILTAMFGVKVDVEKLEKIDDALKHEPVMPAHLCNAQSYVGLSRTH